MIIKDAPQPWVQCVLNKIFIKKTETPIPRNADRKAIFTEEVLYIAKLKDIAVTVPTTVPIKKYIINKI
jgi:hypothetical protein